MSVRTLASVGAGLVLILGIVTATLWRELHAERARTAALRTEMAGPTGHAPAPLPTPRIDAGTAVPPQNNSDALVASVPPPVGAAAIMQNAGVSEQERLKDPEYRKARLAALRSTIAQSYPGLVEELRLTDYEADRLFSLLTETRLALMAEAAPVEGQPQDPAVAAEIARNRRALQRQQGESLRTLLGNARYSQWQEYQQTQSARVQASTYATALAQAGAPLDSSQTRTIAMAMIAEQERLRQDIVALARNVNLASPQTQVQAQAELTRRQAESSQRVLDAVLPYLSAQQLRVLRRQIELKDASDSAAASLQARAEPATP